MKTLLSGVLRAGSTLLLSLTLSTPAHANNVSISDIGLTNAGGGMADIQFTLGWENSWRESWTEAGGTINVTNWDAVWVFAKWRQNGGLWKHVMLAATGHTPAGGTAIDAADNGGGVRPGALVHRDAAGSGTVTCTDMRLRWDFAAAGIPSTDDIDLTVIGVEMVFIPEGAFFLGSGGTETNHFYAAPDTAAPYQVTSEAEITVGDDPGNLKATGGGDNTGPVPAAYPKGYGSFYCMKYEITEGQYVGFLNLLDPGITAAFFPNAAGNSRHTIAAAPTGGFETTAPDRACGHLNAARIAGYLDWAGLRPMTEFEFEKTCRGVKQPWVNEFAWGNTSWTQITGFQGTDGSGTETALPAGANLHQTPSPGGPVRVGIFATATTTREQAGAGYYGVLEMSGNLSELIIGINESSGRSYTGAHGDGDEYNPLPADWPGVTWHGFSPRGGSYTDGTAISRTSDRSQIHQRYYNTPGANRGGRGVRTAP